MDLGYIRRTPPPSPSPSQDELAIARRQWQRYVRLRDSGHSDWLKLARRMEDYYRGDQWNPEDLAKLEAEGRPAVTVTDTFTAG